MSDTESTSNDDPNAHTPRETAAERLEARKKLLRREINELGELNFQIQCSLSTSKFGNVKHLLTPEALTSSLPAKRVSNYETTYIYELQQLAGMYCPEFQEDEYVFKFPTQGKHISEEAYGLQIIVVAEKPTVKKWLMPPSTNMKKILLETPLECAMDLKPFITNCKHHIACFTNRVEQYHNFLDIVEEWPGLFLDSTIGYNVFNVKFFELEELESEKLYNITLDLIYDSTSVRPHKMNIDTLYYKEKLTESVMKKFKKYFMNFKIFDLKTAFETTISDKESPIIWRKRKVQEEIDLDENSASSSESGMLTQRMKVGAPSKRGKKRKAADSSMRSQGSLSREQSADDPDSEEVEESHLSSSGPASRKSKKRAVNLHKSPALKPKKIVTSKAKAKPVAPKKKTNPETSGKQNVEPSKDLASKKKTNPKTSGKKNVEPSKDLASKKNLRQSTLGFEPQVSKEVESTKPNDNGVPLAERLASTSKSVMTRRSMANSTLLQKGAVGTSTPVSRTRNERRFASDKSIEVSPIKE